MARRHAQLLAAALLSGASCRFPDYQLGGESSSDAGATAGGAAGAAGTSLQGGNDMGKSGSSSGGTSAAEGGSGATPSGSSGSAQGGGGLAGTSSGSGGTAGTAGNATVGAGGEGGAPPARRCEDQPISDRDEWTITASHWAQGENAPPSKLVDGTSTRWTTGKAQSGNEWLRVDFGESVMLSQVNLQQGADSNDYPREYRLFAADDEVVLEDQLLATGNGQSGVTTTITLPSPASGRYLLIRQDGSSLSWWSAMELEVACINAD